MQPTIRSKARYVPDSPTPTYAHAVILVAVNKQPHRSASIGGANWYYHRGARI